VGISTFGLTNSLPAMGKILLEGMEFFAYHGCFAEEQIIGTRFVVDLEFNYDTAKAEKGDHLADAVNYQDVYRVVKEEMDKKSYLLEHVARRILDAVRNSFPVTTHFRIRISKVNPPIGGKVAQVCCVLEE
jgi:7,8-dihydroneopterin aldolase/epimerase/oxygenase